MTTSITLQDCQARDAADPLAPLRAHFALPAGTIYLDGNSLGVAPKAAAARVAQVVQQEWGNDLIRSWNSASWFDLPQRLGDQLAPLIGAGRGEVVCTDSTSINLYKVLSAALNIAREDNPGRRRIVSERSNFPTDLYIAEGLCRERGLELVLVEPEEIPAALTADVAVLMLTHVNYRTGAMHDMAAVTAAAHAAGILAVWDLAHSAGAVPVDLNGAGADFSIGCGYKYLNGGPGAPAFVWVHPRHAGRFWQPLSGWWGHAAPFQFTPDYQPAPGITRYLCGTQPIISLSALQCGLDVFTAAEALGGMQALRQKSLALTDLFIELVEARCAGHGLGLATPREHARRGSQVCLTRDTGAYAIVQALIARNVIGDFRKGCSSRIEQPVGSADQDGLQGANHSDSRSYHEDLQRRRPPEAADAHGAVIREERPQGDGGAGRHKDILRFGFTPLYVGFTDVWNAVEHLRQVLDTAEWQRPEFNQQHAVT